MAEFRLELDKKAFTTKWSYTDGSTIIMVTGNKRGYLYQKYSGGFPVSEESGLNSAQLKTALENLIGEEVTFVTSKSGENPIGDD